MSDWVPRSLDTRFANPDDVIGLTIKITVDADGSEILPIPAGWYPTIFIVPVSGSTASISVTGVLESEVATTTNWVDCGLGDKTSSAIKSVTDKITALKLITADEPATFYVNV